MNIEIANRLVELRKKNNLSQEDLAAKLGLSRQAVSKWERAEASPDTDNLICLAKIYNVSLDELLKNEAPIEDIIDKERPSEEKKEEAPKPEGEEKKKSYVHIGKDGIHVVDDKEEVHISGAGVNVVDGKTNINIGTNGIHFGDARIESKFRYTRKIVTGLVALLATIAYFLVGGLIGLWHPTWLIFLAIPVAESIVSCIAYRRVTRLSYPIIVTAAYLFIGFQLGMWHPWWVLFLTIPIFYMAFRPLEKLWLKDRTITIDGETICLDKVGHDDDDDDEDEDDEK